MSTDKSAEDGTRLTVNKPALADQGTENVRALEVALPQHQLCEPSVVCSPRTRRHPAPSHVRKTEPSYNTRTYLPGQCAWSGRVRRGAADDFDPGECAILWFFANPPHPLSPCVHNSSESRQCSQNAEGTDRRTAYRMQGHGAAPRQAWRATTAATRRGGEGRGEDIHAAAMAFRCVCRPRRLILTF